MLILLTHANHLWSDSKQVRKMQPYPPLGTLIAAAMLRREGHDVVFLDTTFTREYQTALRQVNPSLVVVCEDGFNFLTKMCLLENRKLACEIGEAAQAMGTPAVVYSSDSTDRPAQYLASGFGQVIVGEVERTLAEIANAPGSGPVPGAVTMERNEILHGSPRKPIADLDTLPSPAWDLLDIAPYRDAWTRAHGYFSMNLVASRGCPYRCNWCAKPLYGDSYRHFSASRFADDVRELRDRFAPDHLWFADDIFGLSAKWTREFAAAVPKPATRFKIQSRCDLMTQERVEALAHAGCAEVWMGVESGSQKVLDAMEKGTNVSDVYAARENLRKHNIKACYFLQFGYPGEDWKDIEATVRLVRETRPDDVGISVSYPLPNTRFHQIVAPQMIGSNWRDSGALEAMVAGAFSSDLYRALADALHREVRGEASSTAWQRVEQLRCVCC